MCPHDLDGSVYPSHQECIWLGNPCKTCLAFCNICLNEGQVVTDTNNSISSPNKWYHSRLCPSHKSHVAKGSPSVCWNCFPKLTKSTWVYGQYVVNSVTSRASCRVLFILQGSQENPHHCAKSSLCCFFQQIGTHCLHYLSVLSAEPSTTFQSPAGAQAKRITATWYHMLSDGHWLPSSSWASGSLTGWVVSCLFFFCGASGFLYLLTVYPDNYSNCLADSGRTVCWTQCKKGES